MRSALKLPDFRRLLGAYAVGQLGDWAAEVALAVLVYDLTASAGAVAGTWLVHRCLFGPAAPLLVARLERYKPERLLPCIALSQAAIFAALAVAGAAVGLVAILCLVAADGLLAPASRALVRTTIVHVTRPAGLLADGNAALNVAFTTNAMLAAAVGGLLTAAFGAPAALTFNSLTFVVVACLLGAAALPHHAPRTGDPGEGSAAGELGAWRSLLQAVRYVRDTRPLGLLIGSDAAFVAFASAINPVEVVLVRSTLQGSSAALGVVLSAWGVGMIASGTVVQRAADRYGRGRMVAFGAGAQAVAFLGMGLSGTIAAVVAFSAVGGIGNGLYGVLLATSVQERIAEAFQARVSGLIEALMTTATACAFVAGGALAAAAGPRAAYLFAGGGSLTVIAYATARLRQDHPGARTRVVARLIVADKP